MVTLCNRLSRSAKLRSRSQSLELLDEGGQMSAVSVSDLAVAAYQVSQAHEKITAPVALQSQSVGYVITLPVSQQIHYLELSASRRRRAIESVGNLAKTVVSIVVLSQIGQTALSTLLVEIHRLISLDTQHMTF